MIESPTNNQFNVFCWNLLMDQTRVNSGLIAPQEKRIDTQIQTLQELEVKGLSLDVVGICEAERTKRRHNGEYMATTLTGDPGYWAMHNKSRRKHRREHIGMFGRLVDLDTVAEVGWEGDDRVSVMARACDVPVAMAHPRNEHWGRKREFYVRAMLEPFEDELFGVAMGDWNALPFEKARRIMFKAGFISVSEALGAEHIATFPTEDYWEVFAPTLIKKYGKPSAVELDDIYVKGLVVHRAGAFVGDSDHAGRFATVSKPEGAPLTRTWQQTWQHAKYVGQALLHPLTKLQVA